MTVVDRNKVTKCVDEYIVPDTAKTLRWIRTNSLGICLECSSDLRESESAEDLLMLDYNQQQR